MITRREFIKAFGALVGTGAIGSEVKPVGDVVADNEAKAVEAEAMNEVPVAIDRAAFNCYPTSPLTTANYVAPCPEWMKTSEAKWEGREWVINPGQLTERYVVDTGSMEQPQENKSLDIWDALYGYPS